MYMYIKRYRKTLLTDLLLLLLLVKIVKEERPVNSLARRCVMS